MNKSVLRTGLANLPPAKVVQSAESGTKKIGTFRDVPKCPEMSGKKPHLTASHGVWPRGLHLEETLGGDVTYHVVKRLNASAIDRNWASPS